jgi:hypothetical protein
MKAGNKRGKNQKTRKFVKRKGERRRKGRVDGKEVWKEESKNG